MVAVLTLVTDPDPKKAPEFDMLSQVAFDLLSRASEMASVLGSDRHENDVVDRLSADASLLMEIAVRRYP